MENKRSKTKLIRQQRGYLGYVLSVSIFTRQAARGTSFVSKPGLRALMTFFLLLGMRPAGQATSLGVSVFEDESAAKEKSFSMGAKFSLGAESNAYAWGTRDHSATSSTAGELSATYEDYTLRSRLAAAKVLKEYEEWKWSEDLRFTMSRKAWKVARDWKLGGSLSLILPVTERSKKYTLLNEGVGGGSSLIWDLGRTLRGLSLRGTVGATHYRYQIPVAFDGQSNERWRLNSRLIANYEFIKDFSLELLVGRTWAWTVNGFPLDRFETDQSLTWAPYEMASVSIGHNRGGNVLRSDGNNNLALYDGRDSNFYLSLDFQI